MTPGNARLVEVEPSGVCWIKSSASGAGDGQNCVEVATVRQSTLVRNSRDRAARLTFPGASWAAFLAVLA